MTADGASSSLRVDPLDCDPRIVELIDAFCHAMRVERNASVHTLRAYRIDLMDFARWTCRERIDILAATHRQLRRYLGELDRAQYSRTTEKPSASTNFWIAAPMVRRRMPGFTIFSAR